MRDYKPSEFISAKLRSETPVIIQEKVCKECKQKKEIKKFSRTSRNLDGYCSTCKDCRAAQAKPYFIAKKKEKDFYSQFSPI